jgi:[ribosomal protein S18]-alanine N-acetyltransferase
VILEIILRDNRPDDLDAMHALDLVCFEPVFQFSRRAMRAFASAAKAIVVIAEGQPGRELAGFVIVEMEQTSAYVMTLDVAPEFRRHGLAKRLMADAEAKAGVAGARWIELHVSRENAAAVHLYEALGYERAALVPHFYGRGLDAFVYRKELAKA